MLRQATLLRLVVPVLCGSALDHVGIQPLLDAVTYYLPSPADKPPVEVPRSALEDVVPDEPTGAAVITPPGSGGDLHGTPPAPGTQA